MFMGKRTTKIYISTYCAQVNCRPKPNWTNSENPCLRGRLFVDYRIVGAHRGEANDQKFKRKDGDTANQLIKAIAVAVSNLAQWFIPHALSSSPMRTVIPADAHAAAKVRVDVIWNNILRITKMLLILNLYIIYTKHSIKRYQVNFKCLRELYEK